MPGIIYQIRLASAPKHLFAFLLLITLMGLVNQQTLQCGIIITVILLVLSIGWERKIRGIARLLVIDKINATIHEGFLPVHYANEEYY